MEDSHHHHQTAPPSRLGMKGGGGEIVEVQGGHILRSTGRKDRHSKVCTAKGPRDRRVRLSAPTAIQFYDVQDRLGYDRPSKAVDWLIKNAKAAIDELAELPAWTPTITASANPRTHQEQLNEEENENENENEFRLDALAKRATTTTTTMATLGRDIHYQIGENPINSSNFLPPSLDSDAIADTIKSFFPMGASAETPSSSIQFQSYPPDLLSRTGSHSQDLRLSLQSFQDPMLLHHQQATHNHGQAQQNEHALFSATTGPVGFDGGWSQHQQAEISRFQRMVGWNAGGADTGISGGTGGGGGGGGFMFHSPPTSTVQLPLPQPFFGHNQLFFQRGPLQSSNTPSIRAWIDPSIAASEHQRHQIQPAIYQSSISGIGYASGEFSGFCIPARIQGEEEHDGIPSSKPSSASSDSANE